MKVKLMPVLIILLLAAAASLTVYSQDKSALRLADEYALALKKYQARKSRASVESVVRQGQAVSAKMDEIESLSDADYALLEKKMRGFTINREEILFVEPDLKFFASVAKTHGTKADIAFFRLMRQIKPDNVWASYLEQQTDVSGCTIYGRGLLTGLYGKSLQFKKTYPRYYAEKIDKEIEDIVSKLVEGNCACGNRGSVVKEYRLFIKTFPNDRNTPKIKEKLTNLKNDKDFSFNCQSG